MDVERAALAVSREPEVEIVVPVHNEERDLEPSVRRLRAYLDARFPFHATVTIADNASTDRTEAIGERLAANVPGVGYMRINDRGRGRALAAAWLLSRADVVAYMDVDLSTDLDALLPLVAPLISGHSEIAIGSRLSTWSRVRRGLKRELISRCYNALLRVALGARFRDAQCGFKAIRGDTARRLVPRIQNRNWFFDTELLILAQRAGLRIHEVPVDWMDDTDSRVRIVPTAVEDLRGIWRLMRSRLLKVVPADRPQVVEDPHAERHDRRDRKVHAELVAEVGQPARKRHVRHQPAEEHARLEGPGDVGLEGPEDGIESGEQRNGGVPRVRDRDRDRRKKAQDDAEDREENRDNDYLHALGVGDGAGEGNGEGEGEADTGVGLGLKATAGSDGFITLT